MSEVKKPRAISSLKSAGPLRAMVDEAYKETVAAVADGKPTAWAMANWWPNLADIGTCRWRSFA